ncbi:serine protease snake-like [Toxorhynchites rutilus septentrionalis]|uniref:serine protease snake-like n=1 Tax=Toxorhynchites rutilus septentrionalis TaxID=329112 RepID=UPI00247A40F0|nr:serine protease snake-like [Toxorhynchites rutilus septentrionalis]
MNVLFPRLHLFLLFVILPSSLIEGRRISEIKCSEYRNQTIKSSAIIPLTINPRPIVHQNFECSKTVDLIVGGETAKPAEFPHQALLGWPKVDDPQQLDFRCGGSLISDRYVLTAAHCFRDGDSPIVVRLGEHDVLNDRDNQADFDIEAIVLHPNYKFSSVYHDIALVKLTEAVLFSKIIRPACLWTSLDVNVTSVVATGFGLTEFVGQSSNLLLKVKLDFLDRNECSRQYAGFRTFKRGIIEEQLCVGSKRGSKDTCQGDSGGPIQVITEPKGCTYHIIGITSTGSACGVGKSPSIYTRVASYLDWIEGMVWK